MLKKIGVFFLGSIFLFACNKVSLSDDADKKELIAKKSAAQLPQLTWSVQLVDRQKVVIKKDGKVHRVYSAMEPGNFFVKKENIGFFAINWGSKLLNTLSVGDFDEKTVTQFVFLTELREFLLTHRGVSKDPRKFEGFASQIYGKELKKEEYKNLKEVTAKLALKKAVLGKGKLYIFGTPPNNYPRIDFSFEAPPSKK